MINNLYFLLFIEVILFIYCWTKFKQDIFSPSTFSVLSFIVSTILNISCIDFWKINFRLDTLIVIAVGLLSMVIAESIFYKKSDGILLKKCYLLKISNPTTLVVAFICIVATSLYYYEMRKLGASLGINSLEAIGYIKENYNDLDVQMPVVIRQGYKVVMALGYFMSFIFANNFAFSKKQTKWTYFKLIPLICCVAISLSSGSRTDMIRMLIVTAFFLYVEIRRQSGWIYKPNKLLMKVSLPIITIVLILFFSARLFVKANTDTQLQMGGFMEYISYYIGSPIQVLNLHIPEIQANWSEKNTFGVTTFFSIYNLFGIKYHSTNLGAGFAYLGGDSNQAGNVQTIMGSSYRDFGLIGMFIYIFCLYGILCYIYYNKILYKANDRKATWNYLLYAFLFYIVCLSFYDDCLKWILCQTGLLELLVLFVIYKFCIKIRFQLD